MPIWQPPQLARVQCPACGEQYDTFWAPIKLDKFEQGAREEWAATRTVVCPHCGHRSRIGRELALHGDLWRVTTPGDSAGARFDAAELAEYLAELESKLRGWHEWEIEDFQVGSVDGVPLVEVVFIDKRVPNSRFGYRNHIWDNDPVVWWANFMEDTAAVMAWRDARDAPSEVIWLR